MSPGALFLPFVLLNHFSKGLLYMEAILQILAGLGTYCLLRKISLTQLAALTGAILYQFSGAFVWLGPPITNPIAFLPWLILGVECVREKSLKPSFGGFCILAASLAFSLYAGFPETAYINGLLAAVWSCWRLFSIPSGIRLRFVRKLATGVAVGLLLSAPIIIPFLEYLGHAYLGGHTFTVGFGGLRSDALPQLFFPCLYGIPWAYHDHANVAMDVWGNVGGYFTAAQLTVIVFGLLITRRSSLFIILLLWLLVCLGRTFSLPLISTLVDLIPLLKLAAFYRYAAPSWEFCGAVLCAIVINDLSLAGDHSRRKSIVGVVVTLSITIVSLYPARNLVEQFYVQDGYRLFLWISLAWGFGSVITVALAFHLGKDRPVIAGRTTTIILVADAVIFFCVPSFSGIIGGQSRSAGIDYLKQHIGTDRFYTLGPISPNYGAYYHIASINHNALPIAASWVKYVKEHIDPYAHPAFFTGNFRNDAKAPTPAEVLCENLAQYERIGVRYVLSPHSEDPFKLTLAVMDSGNKAFNLESRQSVSGRISGRQFIGTRIGAVRILIGNYSGKSDGKLKIQLWANGLHAFGERNLQESEDNQPFLITLNQPIAFATADIQYEISYLEGTTPVALWIYPQKEGPESHNSPEIPSGYAPRLEFVSLPQQHEERPQRVFESSDMDIYELARTSPYFETVEGDCDLRVENRAVVRVNCSSTSQLVRRELYYPGWKASVGGKGLHIKRYNDIFQTVTIPSGQYKIVFTYVPTHIRLIAASFLLGFFCLIIGAVQSQTQDPKNDPSSRSRAEAA
jgi:hypothetical protein